MPAGLAARPDLLFKAKPTSYGSGMALHSCKSTPASDSFDWSQTPLGPRDQWSATLRQAVDGALGTGEAETPSPAATLDALFTAAPLGLAIWDRNFRFVRVNNSLAEMNGLSPGEHVGRLPQEILPDIAELDQMVGQWREILRTGKPWLNVEVQGGTPAAPDQLRNWTEHFFPIRSGEEIVGIGAVVEETTERRRIEAAFRASEARFREFAEASSDVLWLRNTETNEFEFLSLSLRKLFGVEPGSGDGHGAAEFNWLSAILPEDRDAALAALAGVRQGKRVTHDFRTRIPGSGKVRVLKNTAFPLRDPDGRIRRIGGIAQDVTEERDTAQRLQTLIGELQHRTRNLMGVVQAVADSTLATSSSLAEFEAAFGARVAALSRVQNLLSRLEGLERIGFDELLRTELNAFGALPQDDRRVSITGPGEVPLRSGGIQILALALHELITNATKYGALSQPDARLAINWQLVSAGADAQPRLRVQWVESGVAMPSGADQERAGHHVAGPAHSGQGRELIEHAVPYQLDATVDFALTRDGVHCTILLPISQTWMAKAA
jgi:PAS domain S-box-containing protein